MAVGKKDLASELANHMEVPKTQAEAFVDAFVEQIENHLTQGEEVNLTGFGKFMTTQKEARKGRNPQTGESVDIPAHKLPKFKPSNNLKERVKKT